MDLKLELIVLPVSDVDRAKAFYEAMGFRLDLDKAASENWRAVHFTPPGSECSIIFGKGLTSVPPGSAQGMYLVVPDIEKSRAELVDRGIEVSEVFHDAGAVFYHGHGGGDLTHDPALGQGRLRPLVGSVRPLAEAPDAIRTKSGTAGKTVVAVA